MEGDDLFMLMGISMMAIGERTRLMGMAYISIWTERGMKVTGRKISNTDRAQRVGQMVPSIRASMWKERSMGMVNLDGQMEVNMKGNFVKIILKDRVSVCK
jgi:hypothetical protein